MTTFVSQQVAGAASTLDTGRFVRAVSAVREWGTGYAAAFRASAAAPRPEGMDPAALRAFGRS